MSDENATIQAAIADLEERARLYETRAGACRDAASSLREAFGVSTLGPVPVPAPAPAKPRAVPKPAPTVRRVTKSLDEAMERVVGVLKSAREPMQPRDVSRQANVDPVVLSKVVKLLVQAGRVVRTGKTTQTRLSIAGPAPSSAPAAAASPPSDEKLHAEILRVLKSGASADPREIRRNVTAFPLIDIERIAQACEELLKAGRVDRIAVGEQKRYRIRKSA